MTLTIHSGTLDLPRYDGNRWESGSASTSTPGGHDVAIDVTAYDGDRQVSHRERSEHVPR